MKNLLSNSWFIGIVGGWISVVFATTSTYLGAYIIATFFRKKRIEEANQFVIKHLRLYLTKGVIPSDALANALRHNATKKFKVKESDLLSLASLIAELATEIVNNNYLEEIDRLQYLKDIDGYLSMHSEPDNEPEESIKQTLSISFVFTFLISSLYLVAILKGMEELPPNTFPETIEIIQQVGWGRLFLVSLMGIEMLFFVVIFIPVIIVSFLNILVIFVEFLKSPAFRKKN